MPTDLTGLQVSALLDPLYWNAKGLKPLLQIERLDFTLRLTPNDTVAGPHARPN